MIMTQMLSFDIQLCRRPLIDLTQELLLLKSSDTQLFSQVAAN